MIVLINGVIKRVLLRIMKMLFKHISHKLCFIFIGGGIKINIIIVIIIKFLETIGRVLKAIIIGVFLLIINIFHFDSFVPWFSFRFSGIIKRII
jgi:hypothetical protein